MVYPIFGFHYGFFIFITSFLIFIFWSRHLFIIRVLPFFMSIFLINSFSFSGRFEFNSLIWVPLGYVITLSSSLIFLSKKRSYPFLTLLFFGLVFMLVYTLRISDSLNKLSYAIISIWAFNFLILIRENQSLTKPIHPKDTLLSFSSPVNFPLNIYYTSSELLSLKCQNRDEYIINLNSNFYLVIKVCLILFLKNIFYLYLSSGLLNLSSFFNLLGLNSPDHFIVQYPIVLKDHFLSPFLTLVFKGFFLLINLIVVYNLSVVSARACGFKLKSVLFDHEKIKDAADFIRQTYFYYSRIILKLFYKKTKELFVNFGLNSSKNFLYYFSFFWGGIAVHLFQDIHMGFYKLKLSGLIILYFNLIPYFLMLPLFVILVFKNNFRFSQNKYFNFIFQILYTSLFLCLLSFARIVKVEGFSWIDYLTSII
jgi:hypothetical protein